MLDLNPTLHDLQKVVVDQKKKHYKTKHALNIIDEESKEAKSEATTKIRKLAKVYGAWLPPWIAARLVVYQSYVKNQSKEFLSIQGRIWDPGIIFLSDTLRTRWFRRSGECYAMVRITINLLCLGYV
ncbi:hypothetical protein Tco_0731952 [Tanacetum coccineum]